LVKFLAGAVLMARLACQRLEINWDLCLHLWLTRPVVEIVQEDPAARRRAIVRRLDAMYPF